MKRDFCVIMLSQGHVWPVETLKHFLARPLKWLKIVLAVFNLFSINKTNSQREMSQILLWFSVLVLLTNILFIKNSTQLCRHKLHFIYLSSNKDAR